MFPVHTAPKGFPKEIPWSLIEPHRRQAEYNHGGQTLERLAKRGGLDVIELYCVLRDKKWNDWGRVENWEELSKIAQDYILSLMEKSVGDDGL